MPPRKMWRYKMRRIKGVVKKSIATLLLFGMVFDFSGVFAGAYEQGTGDVNVPTGMTMVPAEYYIARSKNYSYVLVQAYAVTPVHGGTDNFHKCKTQIKNSQTSYDISDKYTLSESGPVVNVYLTEGNYNVSHFDLYFSGNSANYPANVRYYYNGR